MPEIKYLDIVTLVRDVAVICGIQKQISQKHFSPWSGFITLANPLKPGKCLCNKTETYIMRASYLGWLQSPPYPRIVLHAGSPRFVLAMQYAEEVKWEARKEMRLTVTRAHTSPSFAKEGKCTPQ